MIQSLVWLLWMLMAGPPSAPLGLAAGGAGPTELAAAEPALRHFADCVTPPGDLPFFYDLFTFRGEEGKTTIVASYAVEAGELHREKENGCSQYRLVVSLVLADTAARTVFRTDDSVTVRLDHSPRDEELLRTHLEVQAVPSATTLQRVIMSDVTTPGFGQLYHGPFPIPDYGGSQLMLSDLALGDPDVDGGWTRGDVTLALIPTGQVPPDDFDLFYEIYNLPRDHPYSTEIFVEPLDEGAGPTDDPSTEDLLVRFFGESTTRPDGTLPELRRVGFSQDGVGGGLNPGRYRLTVTVRDEVSGETAKRSRPFRIGPEH